MSQMKRLLETLEPVSKDSFMHELLWNACPIEWEGDNFFYDLEVRTYKISLHCMTFMVKCIYNEETKSFTIINYEKEIN